MKKFASLVVSCWCLIQVNGLRGRQTSDTTELEDVGVTSRGDDNGNDSGFQTRIVGGEAAEQNEFPYFVRGVGCG